MDNSAEYWRRAQSAYEQAREATNEKDKATWLRIAESFETLFRLAQREEAITRGLRSDDPDDPSEMMH